MTIRDQLYSKDPIRVVMTEKMLKNGWGDRRVMPMRNYTKEFLADDSLGIVHITDKLKVYIGCMFFQSTFKEENSIKFHSVEDLIEAGWLVD